MADSDLVTLEDYSVVDLVSIKVTKGNGLSDIVTETFDGQDFAATEFQDVLDFGDNSTGSVNIRPVTRHGMAIGKEAGRAVRVSKQVAALGARGDYIDVIAALTTGSGTSSFAICLRNMMVQVLDYSGVPVAVQHSIFGKYSPFVTPSQPVSKSMLAGIDRQEIEAVHNVVCAVAGTAVNQKIRGTATARLKATVTGVTGSETEMKLRLTPNGDGVFVIPRGAVLWAGPGLAATKTTTLTIA
jgi:hypothetical protein